MDTSLAATHPRLGAWSRRSSVHLVWVVAGWVLGFVISAVFSGVLELARPWFLLVYLLLAGPFLYAYARWSDLDLLGAVRHRWMWGIVGAAAIGAMMIWNVLGWDSSPRPEGLKFVLDLLWLGVVYGVLDALFLSVLPVVAVWRAFVDHAQTWTGRVAVGALALLASTVMTATYHLGYMEFRGDELREPLVGNAIFTLGYLLTMNPSTAVVGHVILHVASVWYGIDTTISLPPHY
jgi:hypothetical protein